eukprot:Opistho-2@2215
MWGGQAWAGAAPDAPSTDADAASVWAARALQFAQMREQGLIPDTPHVDQSQSQDHGHHPQHASQQQQQQQQQQHYHAHHPPDYGAYALQGHPGHPGFGMHPGVPLPYGAAPPYVDYGVQGQLHGSYFP